MEQWSYTDYQRAVASAVKQGLNELGFTVDQAVGYARQDLELRLDEHPGELALAMTALASVVVNEADPTRYPPDGDFVEELRSAYSDGLDIVQQRLPDAERVAFLQDVSKVRDAFKA